MPGISLSSAFNTDNLWATRVGSAVSTDLSTYRFINSAGYHVMVNGDSLTYSGDDPASGSYYAITVFSDDFVTVLATWDAFGETADFATYFTGFAVGALGGADSITGSSGDDILRGYGGDDTLVGGDGNDILDGGAGVDVLNGGGGINTASYSSATAGVTADLASPGNNTGDAKDGYSNIHNLVGSSFGDVLRGNGGNNSLAGSLGDDALSGGAGNDILDGGEGTDSAKTSTALTIGNFSFVSGHWVLDAGGDGTDSLTNAERVEGGTGTGFLLVGGGGYATIAAAEAAAATGDAIVFAPPSPVGDVDPSAGSVAENAAAGTPVGLTAHATAPEGAIVYSLADDAGGRFAIDAITGVVTVANGGLIDFETAPIQALTVRATSANGAFTEQTFTLAVTDVSPETVTGTAGSDTLTGTSDADNFVFNTALNKKTNVDTIVDFSAADDTILLANAIFTKLKNEGALKGKYFEIGKKADDKDDYIVYNKKTGDLSYDKNGDHKGGAVLFAQLEDHLKLKADDFFVI